MMVATKFYFFIYIKINIILLGELRNPNPTKNPRRPLRDFPVLAFQCPIVLIFISLLIVLDFLALFILTSNKAVISFKKLLY